MFGLLGTVIGLILVVLGGYMVVFFPSTLEHQSEQFSIIGIVMGLVFLIIGAVLIFV